MRLILIFFSSLNLLIAQCTPITTTNLASVMTHTGLGDTNASNKLASWLTPYQCNVLYRYMYATVDFWINHMPSDGLGHPMFYTYPEITLDTPPVTTDYPHQIAMTIGYLIDAGLVWKNLTGNPNMINSAIDFANFAVTNGTTSSGIAWPTVIYSATTQGTVPYDGYEPAIGGSTGRLEPDKIAFLGYWFIKLWQYNGDSAWLNKATHIADVLVDNRNGSANSTVSPWPFRVVASTGATVSGNGYTASMIEAIRLFDELITLNQSGVHSVSDYTTARDAALNWVLTYPNSNGNWDNCYEDVIGYAAGANHCAGIMMETARYFIEKQALNGSYLTYAQNLFSGVESRFGFAQAGSSLGIAEQDAYLQVTVSATAQYARLAALLAANTSGGTSATYKDKALRAINFVTYHLLAETGSTGGFIQTGPGVNGQFLRATHLLPLSSIGYILQIYPEWGNGFGMFPLPSAGYVKRW